MVTLAEIKRRETARLESQREAALSGLRVALSSTLPSGTRVWIYGSLAKTGRFGDESDIDLAIEGDRGLDLWRVMAAVAKHTGREADVSLIESLRFAAAVRREGVLWTI